MTDPAARETGDEDRDPVLGRLLVLVLVIGGTFLALLLFVAQAWIAPWPAREPAVCEADSPPVGKPCPPCEGCPPMKKDVPEPDAPTLPELSCGDGHCAADAGEDCQSCATDCGCTGAAKCRKVKHGNFRCETPRASKCGNTRCDGTENCRTCAQDCGCEEGDKCQPEQTDADAAGCVPPLRHKR